MEKLGEEDRIEGGGDKDEEERGERERTVQAGKQGLGITFIVTFSMTYFN